VNRSFQPRLWPKHQVILRQRAAGGSGRQIKTSNLPQQFVHPRTACSLIQVAPCPSLRQPTKPRANIIPRYAPILASTVSQLLRGRSRRKASQVKSSHSQAHPEIFVDRDSFAPKAQCFNEGPEPIHMCSMQQRTVRSSIATVTSMGTFNRQFEQRFCVIEVGVS
jgi:hypothetical protein